MHRVTVCWHQGSKKKEQWNLPWMKTSFLRFFFFGITRYYLAVAAYIYIDLETYTIDSTSQCVCLARENMRLLRILYASENWFSISKIVDLYSTTLFSQWIQRCLFYRFLSSIITTRRPHIIIKDPSFLISGARSTRSSSVEAFLLLVPSQNSTLCVGKWQRFFPVIDGLCSVDYWRTLVSNFRMYLSTYSYIDFLCNLFCNIELSSFLSFGNRHWGFATECYISCCWIFHGAPDLNYSGKMKLLLDGLKAFEMTSFG